MKMMFTCLSVSLCLHIVFLLHGPVLIFPEIMHDPTPHRLRKVTRLKIAKAGSSNTTKKAASAVKKSKPSSVQKAGQKKIVKQPLSRKNQFPVMSKAGGKAPDNKVLRQEVKKNTKKNAKPKKPMKNKDTNPLSVSTRSRQPWLQGDEKAIPTDLENTEVRPVSKTVDLPPPPVFDVPDEAISRMTKTSVVPLKPSQPLHLPALSRVAPLNPSSALSPEHPEQQSLEALRSAYLALLRERVEAARTYPKRALRMGLEGKVVVRLTVGRKGEVLWVDLVAPSSISTLDVAAMKTVESIHSLPPLPTALGSQLEVSVPLVYRIDRYGE